MMANCTPLGSMEGTTRNGELRDLEETCLSWLTLLQEEFSIRQAMAEPTLYGTMEETIRSIISSDLDSINLHFMFSFSVLLQKIVIVLNKFFLNTVPFYLILYYE